MAALASLLSVWLLLLLLPCDLGDEPKLGGCLRLRLRCNRQCRGVLGCTDAVDVLRQTQRGWVEQEPGSRGANSSLAEDCRFDAEDLKKEQKSRWKLAVGDGLRLKSLHEQGGWDEIRGAHPPELPLSMSTTLTSCESPSLTISLESAPSGCNMEGQQQGAAGCYCYGGT